MKHETIKPIVRGEYRLNTNKYKIQTKEMSSLV